MDQTPEQNPKPPHNAVKIYDRPERATKLSPALIGVIVTALLLLVGYGLYRHFAH